MELVGHLFVDENHPHNVDEGASWKAINDWIGHGGLPCVMETLERRDLPAPEGFRGFVE
jgi:hypothetical protein